MRDSSPINERRVKNPMQFNVTDVASPSTPGQPEVVTGNVVDTSGSSPVVVGIARVELTSSFGAFVAGQSYQFVHIR